MEIEKHIKNLEEYCEVDNLFEKDGDFKEFCDNHIADIKAIIQELKNTQSDLYEANNCISDLLDIAKQRDKRISDLEYALLDMILQFADEDKDSINTMGLSALETAFCELDFDDPMPIKEVHKLYKKLAKKYFEKRCEDAENKS